MRVLKDQCMLKEEGQVDRFLQRGMDEDTVGSIIVLSLVSRKEGQSQRSDLF